MNIGSVRMTERHLTNDPPTQTQIDEAVADVDEHIDEPSAPWTQARPVPSLACPAR